MHRTGLRALDMLGRVFPWPLLHLGGRAAEATASALLLVGLLASRLLLLADGPWEQDEALLASGVVDFDPGHHMPLPPGFPLWVFIGRAVRLLGVADPLVALQVASSVLSVVAVWALVGLWDRLLTRPLAVAAAVLAAFLPGIWFHAPRGFSETPAAALAIVALALWLRCGRAGFVPGVLAMTAAALVRPPLAPFFMVAVLLAAWGVRREPGRLVRAAAAAAALVAAVMAPAVFEAGGVGPMWQASAVHAGEHFGLLGFGSWRFVDLGYSRALGGELAAWVFLGLALLGGWVLRRALGWRWLAAVIAGAWLGYLLLFVHNHAYPRYWVLLLMLLTGPLVAGLHALVRRRAVTAGLALAGAALGAWWTLPAMLEMHRRPLPVVEALRAVAAEGRERESHLVFEDQLFSFRNLAARQGWLRLATMRLSEVGKPRLNLGGGVIWFLTESDGQDVPANASRAAEIGAVSTRVQRLSQERFLSVRLVRNPVLVWRGGSIPEWEGRHRFIWCARRSLLLLPPVEDAGAVALAADVHEALGEVGFVARLAGREVQRGVLRPGRQVIRVPLPALPEQIARAQVLPLELELEREIRLMGDFRPLAMRLFRVSVEAAPHLAAPASFYPATDSMFHAVAAGDGFFGPEMLGQPPQPATWSGPLARFEMPLGPGSVAVDLLAPRPESARIELRLGSAWARAVIGPRLATIALPVPDDLAATGHGTLEIESSAFVPGGGDTRQLGVAIARIAFVPAAER